MIVTDGKTKSGNSALMIINIYIYVGVCAFLLMYMVSLFNRLFNAKAMLVKDWQKSRNIPGLLRGICPKVNVIVRQEFELAYNDSGVQKI